jgi:hypothetical protein
MSSGIVAFEYFIIDTMLFIYGISVVQILKQGPREKKEDGSNIAGMNVIVYRYKSSMSMILHI